MLSKLATREEREGAINGLLQAAKDNPLVDNAKTADVFSLLSGEVLMYERVGMNYIPAEVQELIDEYHDLREFLLSYIDPAGTITVQMSILGSIV